MVIFMVEHKLASSASLIEEARAAEPEPVEVVDGVVRVEKLRFNVGPC